jgi:hypothetical protein
MLLTPAAVTVTVSSVVSGPSSATAIAPVSDKAPSRLPLSRRRQEDRCEIRLVSGW